MKTETQTDKYFINFFEEKEGITGFDFCTCKGNHIFDFCYTKEDILKILLSFNETDKKTIRNMFIYIDFKRGDINHFIEYILNKYCNNYIEETLKNGN